MGGIMPGPGSSSGPPCSSWWQLGPAAGGSWQLGHAPRFLSPASSGQSWQHSRVCQQCQQCQLELETKVKRRFAKVSIVSYS